MIDWIGSIFGIIGMYVLTSKKEFGSKNIVVFQMFLISNFALILYSISIGNFPLLCLYLIYQYFSIKGLFKEYKKLQLFKIGKEVSKGIQ
jgi:hypothetical protein